MFWRTIIRPIYRSALMWGLFIGLANLVWLYAAYYLGLHTNGVAVFQVFMAGWFLVTLVGFILALRAVKQQDPTLSYWRGVGAGVIAAVVSALVAVVMQIGYYKVVHPAWPEYMVQQSREYYTAQGMNSAEIEQKVETARNTFTLPNYAVMSAATAFVAGVVLSAIIMIFLRNRVELHR